MVHLFWEFYNPLTMVFLKDTCQTCICALFTFYIRYILVGFHNINCGNGKEAHNIMEWHIEKTTDTNGVLYIAFTAQEYDSLHWTAGQHEEKYMMYSTSPFDALTTLTYPLQSTRFANTISTWCT